MPQDSSKNLEGSIELDKMSIREILDFDLPDIEVTEETRRKMVEYSKTHIVGDVRIALGKFYMTEEYNDRRRRIRSTPLP